MSSMPQRRFLLLLLALVIVIAVLIAVRIQDTKSRQPNMVDDSPEACIARLLSAEELGDSRSYLDCFSQAQRERFETRWQGQSESQIATELRSQFAGLVGRVVTDLKFADTDHVNLVLERIRQDHTERHQVTLERKSGRWQINTLSKPECQVPAIPYGTPVVAP